MTGDLEALGESTKNGLEFAVAEWNAQGGVLGKQIELAVADDKNDPDQAFVAATKLIKQDKVKFIVGAVTSPCSIPVSEIANSSQVVMISPTSTDAEVTVAHGKRKEYVFRACFTDPSQGSAMASFALNHLGIKKAAVLYDSGNDYARGLASAFGEAFEEGGGRITAYEAYGQEDTDFSARLINVLADPPDLLYIPDYYNKVNGIAWQARDKGFKGIFAGGDGWDSSGLDLAATDGGYFTNHYSPEDTRPQVQAWVDAYRARYGSVPDALATLAYDATTLLLNAIKTAGSEDTAKVKDAMAATKAFRIVSGEVSFDANGDPVKDVVIMQISGGRQRFITVQAPSPTATRPPIELERLELVTDEAATGDGSNAWGGHQLRIARTDAGIFTAYTVAGQGRFAREWRLAQRTDQGWRTIAQGMGGQDPVHLLQGPDGRLYLHAWPEGLPRLWSSTGTGESLRMVDEPVPGNWPQTHWPYSSAGISPQGDLYLLASYGESPAEFRWARRSAADGSWSFQITPIDYRFCYTYVMPGGDGSLSLTSTRDVLWETLGYTKPQGAFDYVFNAVKTWFSPQAAVQPLQETLVRAQEPTADYTDVFCNGQTDAYVDSRGRLHILYWLRGPSTGGATKVRHAVVENGRVTKDVELPDDVGYFTRMVEDSTGRLYVISAYEHELVVLPATSDDATSFGPPTVLDLGEYNVVYSGQALGVPRGGVPLADYVDGVFPSGDGEKWVYSRIRLR